MNTIASFVKRQALLLFCALTVALSFATTVLPISGEAVPVIMVFIPALVALSLTAVTDGWSGVRALVGKLGQWRLRPLWIVAALAIGLALRLAMSVVALLLGWIPAIQLRQWSPTQLAFFAAILLLFAIPEELGWRGYAMPKLLGRYSPLVVSLTVGVVWGVLHLALTLPGMIYAGAPPLPLVVEVAGLSVVGMWLYLRSGGNLLVTSVFHAAQSFFVIVNDGIALEQQLWLMAGVFSATAALVTMVAGSRFTHQPDVPITQAPGGEAPALAQK